jgi:hypothetical protein
MTPLLDKLIAAVISGATSGLLAAFLDHLSVDSRVSLGVCLAAFGVVDKLLFDLMRDIAHRRRLRESLGFFFDQLRDRADVAPLWDDLRKELLARCDSESRGLRLRLLQAALSDVVRLTHHTSFIAIEERDIAALRQLDDALR